MCTAQFAPRGATPAARCGLRVLFNLGRIATYSLIGLLVGPLGRSRKRWQAASASRASSRLRRRRGLGLRIVDDRLVSRSGASLTMAGLGGVAHRRRSVLNRAPPAAAPVLLGALQDGFLRPGVRGGEAARRSPARPSWALSPCWCLGWKRCPRFCVDAGSAELLRRVRTQRLAGVLWPVWGAFDHARPCELWTGAADGCVMSTTHAGVICGLASRSARIAGCRCLPVRIGDRRRETLLFCCVAAFSSFASSAVPERGGAPTGSASSVSPHSSAQYHDVSEPGFTSARSTLSRPEVVPHQFLDHVFSCACRVRAARRTDAPYCVRGLFHVD